jgi:hypothetical protein
LKRCPVCESPAHSRCSRCKSVCYCSQECQRSHWNSHKKDCRPKN